MKKIFPYIFLAPALSLALAVSSCNDDDLGLKTSAPTDGAIRIGANIETLTSTRTYIEEGTVKEGKFLLTYPYYYSGADAYGMYRYLYHYGEVTFGYQGEESTGFVNVGTPTVPKYLVWSPTNTGTSSDDGIFVYPAAKPSPIVMDNFMYKPTLNNSGLVDTVVNVATWAENPYKAGIFDDINGTNDLLWGKVFEKTGTPQINFDLSHRMCRLRLNVQVERNEVTGETQEFTIDLSRASVKITDVLLSPLSYLRLYGNLLFQAKDGNTTVKPDITAPYQDFKLVRSEADANYDLPDPATDRKYQWANRAYDEATGVTTYTTQDFVFVPQILRQGTSQRPRIVIAVPKGDVNEGINPGYGKQDSIYFSANIPVTMLMDNEGDIPPSLQTLNFDPGKIITLTTKMKPGEMTLEFAPVTVEPWVYKGTFYPTAKQSGIYTAEDLYTLIDYYNAGDAFWMRKFGYLEQVAGQDRWRFMINSGSLEFDAYEIVGKMIPDKEIDGLDYDRTPNFIFDFRSRDEYYIMPDGSKISMGILSSNLDNIVQTPRNQGVASLDDFNKLTTAYQNNFWEQFIYGDYDPETEEWTFRITQSIDLDYKLVGACMLPPANGTRKFKFEYEPGVTVNMANYPSGSTGSQQVDPTTLHTIVTNRIPGLYSADDFNKMLTAMRTNDVANLTLYGTQSGTHWTFPLQRSFLVKTENIQGALHDVDVSNYEIYPDRFELSLYQYDGTTLKNPSSQNLFTMLTLQVASGIDSADDFYNLISIYNANPVSTDALSQYGYYTIPSGDLIFFFNQSVTLNKARIQGSMLPADNKPGFSFQLNYWPVLFEDQPGDGITGSNGALELYEIVTTPAASTPDQP